jgi:6-phosphofructokinase 1
MVTLVREPGVPYRCSTGLAPLSAIANSEKLLPAQYLTAEGTMIADAFRDYAEPLIGDPVPGYARLVDIPLHRG